MLFLDESKNTYRKVDQYRHPKKGEYFLFGAYPATVCRAATDLNIKYPILAPFNPDDRTQVIEKLSEGLIQHLQEQGKRFQLSRPEVIALLQHVAEQIQHA